MRAMGIRGRPISPGPPWQNPQVERLHCARECLDRMLISARRACGILPSYAAYYNEVGRCRGRERCALCCCASQTVDGTSMTPELKMLGLSIVLGLAQIVLASHAASLQRGYMWTASARDEAVAALTGLAGRLNRALQNFIETFPLFATAVLMVDIVGKHNWMTETGASSILGLVPLMLLSTLRAFFWCARPCGTSLRSELFRFYWP